MAEIPRNVRPYYEVSLKIGEADFSRNLMRVTILSSVSNPYQSVSLLLLADNRILIRKGLFGKDDIELTIQKTEVDSSPSETIKLDLVIVSQKVPLSAKHSKPDEIDDNETITLITMIKEPFVTMSTTVNMLFDESKRLTPLEMVTEIINTYLPGISTSIKEDNKNTEIPYQFIIPPMTLIDALKYIDGSSPDLFNMYGPGLGIFKGPMFFMDRFTLDGHEFCLWDLGSLSKGKEEYSVYQLAQGSSTDDIIKDIAKDSNKFITFGGINHVYRGNQDLLLSSYENRFLSKSLNELSIWRTLTLDDVFKYAIGDRGTSLDMNEINKQRLKFNTIGEVGMENSDNPYIARLSRKISTLSEIELVIQKNIIIEHLSKVGVPIFIDPQTEDYKKLGGKYIVSGSQIHLKRETDRWVCIATIKAFRGNLE